MINTSESLEKVAEELSKLPSIGRKTAHRIAMYLAKCPEEEIIKLTEALHQLKKNIKLCSVLLQHNRNRSLPYLLIGKEKQADNLYC